MKIKYNKNSFISKDKVDTFRILVGQRHSNAHISYVLQIPENDVSEIAQRLGLRLQIKTIS